MSARDFFYPSAGGTCQIHGRRWTPEGPVLGVVQIIHGIAEYVERYDEFAAYLNSLGFLVVAEDHMGHGQSVNGGGTQGFFDGGWFTAAEDSFALLQKTRQELPDVPYVLFGHSMGSFLARTILERYPDSGITAAVICGTAWQPEAMLPAAIALCKGVCRRKGERTPSRKLENLVFGGYNRRVEHPRTPFDWLTRDKRIVDAYIADPLCGFTPTAGLLRDMLTGLAYTEKKANLRKMNKNLPVLFVAGGDDPVGNYGAGVARAEEAFRGVGMADVQRKIYPLGRHEILNELNRREIFTDVAGWMQEKTGLGKI